MYRKCEVEMVICETEMRSNMVRELMVDGFLVYKLSPIESVDVHIASCYCENQPFMIIS